MYSKRFSQNKTCSITSYNLRNKGRVTQILDLVYPYLQHQNIQYIYMSWEQVTTLSLDSVNYINKLSKFQPNKVTLCIEKLQKRVVHTCSSHGSIDHTSAFCQLDMNIFTMRIYNMILMPCTINSIV